MLEPSPPPAPLPSRSAVLAAAAAALAAATIPRYPAFARTKSSADYFPPPEAEGGWRSLVPADAEPSAGERAELLRIAGVDWSRLAEAFAYASSFGGRSALLVIRRGWIVGEWGQSTPFFLASISKSLTGVAMARIFELSRSMRKGKILGPNTPAFELLPASFASRDPRKRTIKLGHLLSMTSGLEPDDAPYDPGYGLERILERPLSAAPGEQWAYCSASVDLLGIAIQRVAGRSVAEVFNADIAPRIGMEPLRWDRLEELDRACCAARAPARDLARLGWLVLRGGRWGTVGRTKTVLSAKLVRLFTQPSKFARRARFAATPNSAFPLPAESPAAYGKLWWTNATGTLLGPSVPPDAFYAHGFGENLLVVVPSRELVVVRLGTAPSALPAFRRELMARVMAAIL